MKVTPKTIEARNCERYLVQTGQDEILSKKIKAFVDSGKGFTVKKIRRCDYNTVINRDGSFWEDLGFKEINMNSTKSKKANALLKRTRKSQGKIFYNCLTKRKLGFLIPTYEYVPKFTSRGIKCFYNTSCYTIIIL